MNIFDLNIHNVLLWVFGAWHYALFCGYISDDHSVIEGRKDIIPDTEKNPTKESYWVKVFNDGVIMYYWNWIFFKLRLNKVPFAWHLVSLILHMTNVYLLWVFLTPIIGNEAALCAAAFWGVNPMLNQNVVWISGRPYLITVCLTLVALINWHNPCIVLPLYALAVITNITTGMLPLIGKLIFPDMWQSNAYLILMFVVGFPFILWKFHMRFNKALVIDRDNFRFKARRFFALARVCIYYAGCFFIPVKMGWYHEGGFRYNPKWDKFNIWALLGLTWVGFLMTQGWVGWWVLLGILPNSNLLATNSFLQDRYTYFGMIGISILIAPYMASQPYLFTALMAFYISRSYMYSRHMQNDEKMYRENWRNHPRSDYAANNLAFFLIAQKRYEEARIMILRAIETEKGNKMLWYNLGITWAATGHLRNDEGKHRFIRAIDCWKQALAIEPRWSKPADDIQRMIEFLMENKVVSLNPDGKDTGGVSMDIPIDDKKLKELKGGKK